MQSPPIHICKSLSLPAHHPSTSQTLKHCMRRFFSATGRMSSKRVCLPSTQLRHIAANIGQISYKVDGEVQGASTLPLLSPMS